LIEIEDVEIDWKEEYANDPKLILYVDELPDRSEIQYEGSKEEGIWYGEHESGYVSFFAWSGGQQDGFGGRHYEIETVDGEEVTLKGPWSSRAGVMNQRGYGPCLDVLYRTHLDQLGGQTGAITLEAAEEAARQYLEDVEFERIEKFDANEPYYIPTRNRGENR
jgi:hypothetical protein